MKRKTSTVSVDFFGNFAVKYKGKRVFERTSGAENQSWQLLKYMLVNAERVVSSQELFEELAFAGRVSDEQNTLRVRLRRSRMLLAPLGLSSHIDGLLLYRNDRFWINNDYTIASDRRTIDLAYMLSMSANVDSAELLHECVSALGCFKGRYLAGSVSSAWIERSRQHYDEVFVVLLERCVKLMDSSGDWSSASTLWQSALRMLPHEAQLHSKLLQSLVRAGMSAEASNYYSKLSQAGLCDIEQTQLGAKFAAQ